LNRIATDLNRVHAVTLTGTAGSVVHTTPSPQPKPALLPPATRLHRQW
jgi:hypothetical protein